MRPKFWFYPYSKASKSVWNLVDEMPNSMIIKRTGSSYVYRRGDVVINWGNYGVPNNLVNVPVLNLFYAVEIASSKMNTFNALNGTVSVPEFTNELQVAQRWCRTNRVLGRDVDRGFEGSGITVYERGSVLNKHRFYVKYKPKQREFRVHVFNGRVIDVQEKVKRLASQETSYIRNTKSGYVFVRARLEDHPVPNSVLQAGISAVDRLDLNFGGVDVGFHSETGPIVYEVNTAPGIEGTTVQRYKQALEELV